MRITVILSSHGGELERASVEVRDDDADTDERANLAIQNVIDGWVLSPGDTITIEEVE